jgi:hypothetical protein
MQENTAIWTVRFSAQSSKQVDKSPTGIRDNRFALVAELESEGSEQSEWRNYGKLVGKGKKNDIRHCRLDSGKPRYAAVWKVLDLEDQIMDVIICWRT